MAGRRMAARWNAGRVPPGRVLRLTVWNYLVWVVLTWSRSPEQLLTGLVAAVLVAVAVAPFGEVARPWAVLSRRRLAALARLAAGSLVRIVVANARLTRRIWSPHRSLSSGMVIVPTTARGDGELATLGLLSSLVVDNQIVDLDREHHVLQYHAVAVPERGHEEEQIAAAIERELPAIFGPGSGR
jgi:multicomponent Na+:H+ antiporter subunit E